MSDDSHLAERAARAAKIIAAPDKFKICEGCDSIVAARVVTCPNCHGYRFNEEAEAVIEQAKSLAARPQTSVTSWDLE
jgi:RNA polymerase subunit RPABC4/transcription elongation factor Spt4